MKNLIKLKIYYQRNKEKIILNKIYLQRSTVYQQLFYSVGFLYVIVKLTLDVPLWSFPLFYIAGFVIARTVGYLDFKYVLEHEQNMLYDKSYLKNVNKN